MSFERLAFQSWIEGHLGCVNLDDWENYRAALESCQLQAAVRDAALVALSKDAASLLHKAALTFVGAYDDLLAGHRSWAIVKLYYSLFYVLRARLCSRHHGMVRNKNWHHFDLNANPAFAKRLTGQRYRNDHESTLSLYYDLFGNSDPLTRNTVDGSPPFQWLMEQRNIANYRLARFTDPEFPLEIPSEIRLSTKEEIDKFFADTVADKTHTLLFQPEYAWLGLPLKHVIAGFKDLAGKGQKVVLPVAQLEYSFSVLSRLPSQVQNEIDPSKIFHS